jgi:hypothetical protein
VCRQRPELWVNIGYVKLCVDSDFKLCVETELNCGDSFLHEAVFRTRAEMWMKIGYM